jgi:acyl dehydratase
VRSLVAILVCAAALAAPAGAAASVILVNFTSPVHHGDAALLVARVTGVPPRCTIAAFHKGRAWHAKGLTPRRPSAGIVSWAWQTGSVAGRWRIVVSCGSAGSLTTTLVVT